MSEEIKKTIVRVLIDCSIEEFNKGIEDTKNMTHLANVKKMLEMEYQRVTYTKKCMIKYIAKHKDDENYEEAKTSKLLTDLYKILQKIEDRATIVQCLIEKRYEDMNFSTLTKNDN